MPCPNPLQWIQTVTVDQLPTAPFRWGSYRTVIDSHKWLGKLQEDARGKKSPRVTNGAILADINFVYDITEGEMTF